MKHKSNESEHRGGQFQCSDWYFIGFAFRPNVERIAIDESAELVKPVITQYIIDIF